MPRVGLSLIRCIGTPFLDMGTKPCRGAGGPTRGTTTLPLILPHYRRQCWPSERDAALRCHRVLWPPCPVWCIPLWCARCRKRGLSPAERSRYGPHFDCSASRSRLLKEAVTAKSSSLARHDSFSSGRPGSHSYASRPLQPLRQGMPRRRARRGSRVPHHVSAHRHGAVPRGQICGFLLSPICGITSPTGFSRSHTVLCTPHRPREGGR
jgi:hypothetical protein